MLGTVDVYACLPVCMYVRRYVCMYMVIDCQSNELRIILHSVQLTYLFRSSSLKKKTHLEVS